MVDINFFENNADKIIENLPIESVDVYSYIQKQFKQSPNISNDYLFQFVFRNFYRLDNAGLTSCFKKAFFEILEEKRRLNVTENDFRETLHILYEKHENIQGQKNVQFSFVTKLYSTIDDNLPIYDSEVARMFKFTRPYQTDFESKSKKYFEQYISIRNFYEKIIEENQLSKTIDLFDQKFSRYNINRMKKIDFIFWTAGKLERQNNVNTF